MRKKISFHLLLVLCAFLSGSLLRADDFFAVKDKIVEESQFKLSFLYFTPLLLLENVGYTSNVFNYDTGTNPDWTGDVGLGLRGSAVAANRLILQAEDLPVYSYYLENSNLRTWSNRFKAAAYSYAGPLNFKVSFVLNDLTQRPIQEFSRPFHYKNSAWSGEIDWGNHSSIFLTAYAKFGRLAYDENPYLENFNLAESLNRRETAFGLTLNRRIFTRTIVFLNYELNDFSFTANSGRNSRSQSVGIGMKLPEMGILHGGFQIGFVRIEPKNPLFKTSQNLNGQGNVSLTLFKRLRFNLFYALQTNFSFTADELYFDNQEYGGGVDLYLTSYLKLGGSYQEGRMNYHSFIDLATQRRDRTSQQHYYLAVPFFGNASFGMGYTIYRLRSDALNLDITRSYWGGFINYEF
jgi:hypothetical protein